MIVKFIDAIVEWRYKWRGRARKMGFLGGMVAEDEEWMDSRSKEQLVCELGGVTELAIERQRALGPPEEEVLRTNHCHLLGNAFVQPVIHVARVAALVEILHQRFLLLLKSAVLGVSAL